MSASPAADADHGAVLMALYDTALPQVYGYLRARVPTVQAAEELTSETFLAAVAAAQQGTVQQVTVAWLVGIARHKLMDHWRRAAREERNLRAVEDLTPTVDDPWDEQLDAHAAHEVLRRMGLHHRIALSLRYLDGLSVPEVATTMGRTVHATEALLVRARSAFRDAYGERSDDER